MSDWSETRESIRRFKEAWRESDSETRTDIVAYIAGPIIMGIAIITAFGWPGLAFDLDLLLYIAGKS